MNKKIYLMLILLFVANNGYSATTVYTDRAIWEAQLSAIMTEDFTDTTLDFGLGFASSGSSSGLVDNEFLGENQFFGLVGSSSLDIINWSFVSPIYAFGGDWDLDPGANGGGLNIFADSTSVDMIVENGFWGFISDTAFSTVTLQNVGNGTEAFLLDNLSFTQVSAIPVPPAFWLFLTGLMVVFGLKKQKEGVLAAV